MTNQTTATAPKRGMQLSHFNNKTSISKAEAMRPQILFHSLQHSDVLRSDGKTYAHVEFFLVAGEIWACCDCYAAKRALPCYHVAAAAISNGILSVPAETPLAVEDDTIKSVTYDAIEREQHTRDRFQPKPRESWGYTPEVIAAENRRFRARFAETGWADALLVLFTFAFLLLASSSNAQAQTTDDTKIKTCIAEHLAAAPSLAGQQISVDVANGKATLSGTVQTTRQKGTATRVAKAKACAASEVINNLKATDPTPPVKRKPKGEEESDTLRQREN